MDQKQSRRTWWASVCQQPSLLVSLQLLTFTLVALLLLARSCPNSSDFSFHLVRSEEIARAFRRGTFSLTYSETMAQGLPLPIYVYYSQWIYWPVAWAILAGVPAVTALIGGFAGGFVFLVVGAFHLFRRAESLVSASWATPLFVGSAYVLGLGCQRGAYAELVASGFVIWSAGAWKTDGIRFPWLFVVAGIGAWLAHPLTALNSAPFLVVHVLTSGTEQRRRALHLAIGAALVMGGAAFFVAPAFLERPWVLGDLGLRPHGPGFAALDGWLDPLEYRTAGVPLLLITGVASFSLFFRSSRRSWAMFLLLLLYGALLTRWSKPVWLWLPGLRSNIFPWRLWFSASLTATALIVSQATLFRGWLQRVHVAAGLGVLLGAAGLLLLAPRCDLKAPNAALLSIAQKQLRQRKTGFGVSEYLPRPGQLPPPPHECARPRLVRLDHEGSVRLQQLGPGECLLLPAFASPRYRLDGAEGPIQLHAEPKRGQLVVAPPLATSQLRLVRLTPGHVHIARVLSLLSLVVAALLAFFGPIGFRLRSTSFRDVDEVQRAGERDMTVR